jgi:hypothetical protein
MTQTDKKKAQEIKKFKELIFNCEDATNELIKEKEFEIVWKTFEKALEKKRVRTLTHDEAYLAWLLIQKLKPRVMLELGGQHGHSGIIFSDALKRTGGLFITVELGNNTENKYPPESCGTLEFLPDNDPLIIKIWGDANKLVPDLLQKYSIDLVFHDADHTWDHVENNVKSILEFDPTITQLCHDCAEGMWQPNLETKYGYICAERPVFDKYFLNNLNYYYSIFEDKYGIGITIHNEKISQINRQSQ